MLTANTSNFRKNLYGTLEQVAKYNQIATVNTKDGDVVIVNAEDYKNLMETLYISSMPAIKKDLLKAKKAPASDFISEDEVNW
ncbi:type II toxin-antitoxin system Phd/YefM family antitoxin [Pectinatus haikarae]|uniref:type II toxin-antitoxin system Phd/YefM family antitoxin n=1 Tax=Pectinatus haikarae TaxID=349096 RepID=UPI0018C45FF6|nr:type II toxin-antitoxin system Phd/YefM family antitoxin [Pectinatus haikarae]